VNAITDYAIYMLDPAGYITSWNAGAERFKGYTESEIIGEHFSVFYTAEDQHDGLPEQALNAATSDGAFESEGWRVRKDGSRFWAHVIIDPIRNRSGNLTGFAKVTRDLTERKRADMTLKQSDSQLRLLVEGVTDYAIYLLDRDGFVSSWNTGARRIKGYSDDEVIGRHFSLFYSQEDRDRGEPARTLETAAREGRFATEAWRQRKDGSIFWASVVVDPIQADDGSIAGFAKVTRDITETRAARLALERAREVVFQSQKLDAIGQLAGGIAHDFNNILAAVMGGLEIVLRRLPDTPNVTPLLHGAVQAAQRGLSLTRHMIAFGRRQELKPETVALQTLLRSMTDIIQQTLGPAIVLEMKFPEAPLACFVDVDQLELALMNLIMNAADAMQQGGSAIITLIARTFDPGDRADLGPGRYICLSVTDTGEGMDDSTLSRAIEPFFSTRGIGKGSGLGLSMVHGFAQQSGGKLVLKSRKGEGTIAEIWLPEENA
jgi:PAS domain S-box-containing protein